MLINWQALKKHKKETPLLIVDLIVLFLIVLNLSWLLIDSILMNTGFGILFAKYFPHLFHGYKTNYHPELPVYDAVFTIFLLFATISLCLRRLSYAPARNFGAG